MHGESSTVPRTIASGYCPFCRCERTMIGWRCAVCTTPGYPLGLEPHRLEFARYLLASGRLSDEPRAVEARTSAWSR